MAKFHQPGSPWDPGSLSLLSPFSSQPRWETKRATRVILDGTRERFIARLGFEALLSIKGSLELHDCITGARDLSGRFKLEIRNSVSREASLGCFYRLVLVRFARNNETGNGDWLMEREVHFWGASLTEEFPLFPARPRHLCREE